MQKQDVSLLSVRVLSTSVPRDVETSTERETVENDKQASEHHLFSLLTSRGFPFSRHLLNKRQYRGKNVCKRSQSDSGGSVSNVVKDAFEG